MIQYDKLFYNALRSSYSTVCTFVPKVVRTKVHTSATYAYSTVRKNFYYLRRYSIFVVALSKDESTFEGTFVPSKVQYTLYVYEGTR